MTDLYIEKTGSTPLIDFKLNGNCLISGNSRPDEVDNLYHEAIEFIKLLNNNKIIINFIFDFDYFNTFTQRYIYEILDIISKAKKTGSVEWKYILIDEDIKEMGQLYRSMFPKLNIKLKQKK